MSKRDLSALGRNELEAMIHHMDGVCSNTECKTCPNIDRRMFDEAIETVRTYHREIELLHLRLAEAKQVNERWVRRIKELEDRQEKAVDTLRGLPDNYKVR